MLGYLHDNEFITNDIMQKILSVKQSRAYTVIREMVKSGLIVKRGSDREDKEYTLSSSKKNR